MKRVISLLLGFTVAFHSCFSFATPPITPAPPETPSVVKTDLTPREIETAVWADERLVDLERNAKDWSSQQEEVVDRIFTAAAQLQDIADDFIARRGEKKLLEDIKNNQFAYYNSELDTRMEYRLVDGHLVPAIFYNDQIYLLVDENKVSRDSKELKQTSRWIHQHSGDSRPVLDQNGDPVKNFLGFKKIISGRDIIYVFLKNGETQVKNYPKYRRSDIKWWKEYFLAKYSKPTMGDITMALVVGSAMQGALTLGASWMKSNVLDIDLTLAPTYFTMVYAFVLGTYGVTYNNWSAKTGTQTARIIKSQMQSSVYAYGLILALTPGGVSEFLSTVSIVNADGLNVEGAMVNASIIANGLMNNKAKVHWDEFWRIRTKAGENAGNIIFKIPILDKTVTWSKPFLEKQTLYLIPWSINILALMTLATTEWLTIPGTKITVPILQLAGIPVATLWAKWYAKILANKYAEDPDKITIAEDMRRIAEQKESDWKNSWGMDVKDIPGKISKAAQKIAKPIASLPKTCVRILKGKSKTK